MSVATYLQRSTIACMPRLPLSPFNGLSITHTHAGVAPSPSSSQPDLRSHPLNPLSHTSLSHSENAEQETARQLDHCAHGEINGSACSIIMKQVTLLYVFLSTSEWPRRGIRHTLAAKLLSLFALCIITTQASPASSNQTKKAPPTSPLRVIRCCWVQASPLRYLR